MTSALDTQLSVDEAATLSHLETVVRTGLATFQTVGRALAQIKGQKLYRATHATFDAYCQDKFNFSQNRAQNLIVGARVADQLEPTNGVTPTTERQTRPLVPLKAAQRQQVWDEATANGRQPTAEKVAAHAADVQLAAREAAEAGWCEPLFVPARPQPAPKVSVPISASIPLGTSGEAEHRRSMFEQIQAEEAALVRKDAEEELDVRAIGLIRVGRLEKKWRKILLLHGEMANRALDLLDQLVRESKAVLGPSFANRPG